MARGFCSGVSMSAVGQAVTRSGGTTSLRSVGYEPEAVSSQNSAAKRRLPHQWFKNSTRPPGSHRQPLQSRAAARSSIQGRVGAPPLTHLRGKAAIASRQRRRCAAEVWVMRGRWTLPMFRSALFSGGDFSKQCQLGCVRVGDEAFAGGFGHGGLAGGVEFGFFEVFEDFLGSGDD